MTLTVISGVICLSSILWLVVHQPKEGKRKNMFVVIVLVISFPLMIAGGIMNMQTQDNEIKLAKEDGYGFVDINE